LVTTSPARCSAAIGWPSPGELGPWSVAVWSGAGPSERKGRERRHGRVLGQSGQLGRAKEKGKRAGRKKERRQRGTSGPVGPSEERSVAA
jgi:hypothetical protein